MNYNELAEAYDKQADALAAVFGSAEATNTPVESLNAILTLREKAEDLRAAARQEERAIKSQRFDEEQRLRWMELIARGTSAQERKAAAYEKLVELMSTLRPK